jgi:hypothetical protein
MMTLTPYSREVVIQNSTFNCSLRLNVDNSQAIATNIIQLDDNKWMRTGAKSGTGGYAVYQESVDFGAVTDNVAIATYDLMAYFDAQDGNGYQLVPMMYGTYDPPLTFGAGDRLLIPSPALTVEW